MDLLTKISGIFRREAAPATEAAPPREPHLVTITDLPNVNDATLMELAAVYRCVQLIANACATMPLRREVAGADGTYAAPADRLNRLLTVAPNPWTSGFDFWRAVIRAAVLDGVSYIVPRHDGDGNITRLDFYRASSMDGPSISYSKTSGTYSVRNNYKFSGLPQTETLTEEQVVVIRYLSADGINTQTPGNYIKRAVKLAQAAEDEVLCRVKDGGSPRLILNSETSIVGVGAAQESQLREVARVVDYESRVNKSRIIAAPSGVKATQISATSADLQLQSVREFGVLDVCRFYGVPPQYVYAGATSNYKTAEMASADFMTMTLNPILRGIEAELTRKLGAADGSDRFEFDRSQFSAADMGSRASYFAAMQGTGAFTVNDIRRLNNMPPVAGGDTPLVSANLRTITDINNANK